MATQIFVNLPVKNLERTREFFTGLGFSFDPRFTDEKAACMIAGENIHVMLLMEPFFQTFTNKEICDARKQTEVLVCLSVESRARVDEMVAKALASGGSAPMPAKDHGFMYGHGFHDLDGHIWELIHMAPAQEQPSDGTSTIGREKFEEAYAAPPPWDIDDAQRALQEVAARVSGSLLDAGCGSGENALFFAKLGVEVTGFDFVKAPIAQAKRKASERKLSASFLVKDALTLDSWDARFDNVIDSGLFHVFSDADRASYVRGLAHVVRPGGRLFLLCFSEKTPGTQGPRRVTEKELRDSFAEEWTIDSIEPARFDVRPEFRKSLFNDEVPWGWLLSATHRF